MPSRRTLLMMAIASGAVGSVALITAILGGRRNRAAPTATQPGGAPAPGRAAARENTAVRESAGALVLIPRAQWGASAPAVSAQGYGERGFYSAVNPDGWLVYDRSTDTVLNDVIVHHSALPLTDGPLEIQRLHMEEKGFADIGYHFLIDETGRLFEGRALNVRGAHTLGHNEASVGICLLGNFEEISPAVEQLSVLDALLDALVSLHPGITHLAGHKDYNPSVTLCPGQNFYPLLSEIANKHNLRYGA